MAWVESYTVNGTSFDNHKFAISEVVQNGPGVKGENQNPAMDHGLRWREKRLGPRTETWSMWVCDADPTTGLPAGHSYEPIADPQTNPHGWSYTVGAQEAQYNANLDEVMQILHTTYIGTGYDAPLQVVRRMKKTPSVPANEYRLNYGELEGPIQVSKDPGSFYGQFEANILYMDPRWYECDSSGVKTNSSLTATGNPGGTALMTRVSIALASGTANPYIQNTTTGSKLTYSGTPSSTLIIDTENYTVKDGSTTVTGSLDRSGSTTTDWFQLRPGVSNTLASNVSFTITYSKAYL
jgi:hypothetical protein